MDRLFFSLLTLIALSAMRGDAVAGFLPPPVAMRGAEGPAMEVGALYDLSARIRYRADGHEIEEFDTDCKTISAYVAYREFYLAAGVIHDADFEARAGHGYPVPMRDVAAYSYPPDQREAAEGDGFVVAVGARSPVWERENFALHAFGQLSYRRESYRARTAYLWYDGPVCIQSRAEEMIYPPLCPPPEPRTGTIRTDIDLESVELLVGLAGSYTVGRHAVYAGIELLPYSDIRTDLTRVVSDGSRYGAKWDTDRDDIVSLVLGWRASFERVFVVLECRALGEEGLRAGAGAAL